MVRQQPRNGSHERFMRGVCHSLITYWPGNFCLIDHKPGTLKGLQTL